MAQGILNILRNRIFGISGYVGADMVVRMRSVTVCHSVGLTFILMLGRRTTSSDEIVLKSKPLRSYVS